VAVVLVAGTLTARTGRHAGNSKLDAGIQKPTGDEQRWGSGIPAWYSTSGTLRVRRCPELDAIAAKIRAHCDRDFAVDLAPRDAEVDDFSIEGTGESAAGGVLVLDETLESLGPDAVEAAVLTGEYEYEPYELVVAPRTEAAQRL
jgi:hypothetical protein